MDFNLDIKYIIIGFAVLIVCILITYFMIKESKRPVLTAILSIIGQSIAFLSLFFLLVDKLKQSEIDKRNRVSSLNDMTNNYMTGIINTLSSKERDLHGIYEEIFEEKPTDGRPLTYQENLFMFQLFTIFLNVYRQYMITGGESGLYAYNMYEAWKNFISRVVKADKVKDYWSDNKKLFDSLGFIKFMEDNYKL